MVWLLWAFVWCKCVCGKAVVLMYKLCCWYYNIPGIIIILTVLDCCIILILALAEEEDFTKYIPQPEFIDDYGKVGFSTMWFIFV